MGDLVLSPLSEMLIRFDRVLPGAGQRGKHVRRQGGAPGKVRELGQQILTGRASILECLLVLVQVRPALIDIADRRHDGTAVLDALREKPGEALRSLFLRGYR